MFWLALESWSFMYSEVYGSVGVDARTFELRPDADDENTATTTGAITECGTLLFHNFVIVCLAYLSTIF